MQQPVGRQKVALTDNLPKVPAQRQVQQLKKIYYGNQITKQKYFPLEKQLKYKNNFTLFDRNDDNLLDYEELKQFLVSIGQMIKQEDLKQFYKCLLVSEQRQDGHTEQGVGFDNVHLIVLKKLIEEDAEQQLTEAFKIADQKNEGFIESQEFKQMLMTMGYKWSQQQADQFIKEFEPKSQKKMFPNQIIKKLMKR